MATGCVLPVAAACFAALAGGFAVASVRRRAWARKPARARAPDEAGLPDVGASHSACLGYMRRLSHRLSLGRAVPLSARLPASRRRKGLSRELALAGLSGELSCEGRREACFRLAALGAATGALVGAVASNEMMALGLVAGAAWGGSAPRRAVAAAGRARTSSLERGLPEMLEVVALGVRSGLSFDRSMQLYTGHFDSPLARECAAAQRSWSSGLSTREAALQDLARSYDSPLLSRTVAAMVRSLRFGTSLADVLEQAAEQARALRRAKVGERVAKAPVKMMIPTGTLILPAMLLLVLGPVLLELMKGV